LEDPHVQELITAHNSGRFNPEVDRNMQRAPDRMIHIFSISRRSFTIKRPPLFLNVHLQACPKDERYVPVAHIPDPLMQAVHDVEKARQRGEANDGMLCAIELLNPNNPTYDPDWNPPAEMAAAFSSSKGCDLFQQGLFISLSEVPSEREIAQAEKRRERYYKGLIAHADSLEETNRKELEEFIRGEDGTDLRLALDFFGEKRSYHKPMTATRTCPNCADDVKAGVAFHKNEALGVICVLDWPRAVAAGVKTKSDVPEHLRWWTDDDREEEVEDPPLVAGTPTAAPAASRSRSRSRSSGARPRSSK
jgi:hypothetical protein